MSSVSQPLHSDELAYLTAHELAARIRRRESVAGYVVDASIRRIEARNPSLNALVYLDFDGARARAKEAERALVAGELWGPLLGIPSALKDLFDFKPGWPASLGGIRALKHHVVNGYCVFCERMEKRGGAVFLGKTNSPLMGFRGTCDNYLFGPTRNPFNLAKNTGGSSGGSAGRSPMDCYLLQKVRTPAARYGSPPPGVESMATRRRSDACRSSCVPTRSAWPNSPFLFEGPITRTVGRRRRNRVERTCRP